MTHVNAFLAEVREAEAEVEAAQGKLAAAVEKLKGHPDFKPAMLKSDAPVEEKDGKEDPKAKAAEV